MVNVLEEIEGTTAKLETLVPVVGGAVGLFTFIFPKETRVEHNTVIVLPCLIFMVY